MGALFAILSALIYSISILLSKISVDKTKSPVAVGVFFQMFAGFFSLLFFIFEKPEVYNGSLGSWTLVVIACVVYGLFTIFGFKANKLLEISISTIISQISLLFIFFASALLFQEAVTWMKILGILLLIAGNVLVVGTSLKQGNISKQGVFFRILAALSLTVGVILDGYNSQNFSAALYGFMAYFFGGVVTWVLGRVKWSEIVTEIKDNWKLQLIMGALSATGYFFFIRAMAIAPKTLVVPLNNLNNIFVVILGIIILKEVKSLKRKILAAVLAFIGAVLLSI